MSILIEDKATLGGSARIELVFDPTTFALKQWTVDDAQGYQTVVTLFNVDLTTQPDDSLFKIDEQRMIGQKKACADLWASAQARLQAAPRRPLSARSSRLTQAGS